MRRHTIPEAAALLRVSVRTVWSMIADGEIVASRTRGRTFILAADLDAAILASRQRNAPKRPHLPVAHHRVRPGKMRPVVRSGPATKAA